MTRKRKQSIVASALWKAIKRKIAAENVELGIPSTSSDSPNVRLLSFTSREFSSVEEENSESSSDNPGDLYSNSLRDILGSESKTTLAKRMELIDEIERRRVPEKGEGDFLLAPGKGQKKYEMLRYHK